MWEHIKNPGHEESNASKIVKTIFQNEGFETTTSEVTTLLEIDDNAGENNDIEVAPENQIVRNNVNQTVKDGAEVVVLKTPKDEDIEVLVQKTPKDQNIEVIVKRTDTDSKNHVPEVILIDDNAGEKKIVPEETNNEINNFELVNSTTEGIEVVITTTKDRDINKSVDLIDDNAVKKKIVPTTEGIEIVSATTEDRDINIFKPKIDFDPNDSDKNQVELPDFELIGKKNDTYKSLPDSNKTNKIIINDLAFEKTATAETELKPYQYVVIIGSISGSILLIIGIGLAFAYFFYRGKRIETEDFELNTVEGAMNERDSNVTHETDD